MGKFAYKNTFNGAIFGLLRPKRKISLLKSGISDRIPDKTFIEYRPFKVHPYKNMFELHTVPTITSCKLPQIKPVVY